MNEPQARRDESAGSGRKGVFWFLLLGLGGAALIVFLAATAGRNGDGPPADDPDPLLQLTRVALAATENLATEEANLVWDQIFGLAADDEAAALNRALNRVLRVDQLAEQALDASSTQEKRTKARAALPDAIQAARSCVDDYDNVSDELVLPLWLRSRVDLHYAALLPRAMTRPRQVEVFERLVEAVSGDVGQSPQSIILAGPLTDVLLKLEDPSDGLPDELLGGAIDTLTALSAQNPDNLFLAIHAARLNISGEKAKAKSLVLRTQQLAAAIEPSLSRDTKPIGVTADQLVANIVAAIEAGDWSQATTNMQFWFNVLNPTELVKTDRRRASPHPLDRLSFASLRRLSAAAEKANPIAKGTGEFSFDFHPLPQAGDIGLLSPIDFDIDLDDDLATISNTSLQIWNNDGQGGWTAEAEMELDLQPVGMMVVDLFKVGETHPQRLKAESAVKTNDKGEPISLEGIYRHNVFPSIVVFGDEGVRLIGVDGRKKTASADRLQLVEGTTGLEDVSGVTAAAAGDLEGDGDLDLVFATQNAGVRLFVNRDDRTFFEVTGHDGGFDPDDPAVALAIADLDRDLDLDIITVHPGSGKVGQLENLLHLQFRGRFLEEVPVVEKASSIAVADVDANVSWDLIVSGQQKTAIVFSQTADAGVWTVDRTETIDDSTVGAVVADFDNDSWSELVAATESTRICRIGPWSFGDWTSVDSLPATEHHLANFNGDGMIDFVCLRDGSPVVSINKTESDGHYLNVRFKGIADNAANSGRVNHYAIGSVLELRFGPHYRSRIITSPATYFGLAGFDQATSVRVILPNGLTQTIRNPAVNTLVEEEQRLKGSCPYLYAWDGEKFVFMTDCLWAAPLGLQVARGVVAKDRPWEYLKVDGQVVRPRGSAYEFRITEELWEVAFVDKLAMQAVDHPADVEIWTNEKVGPGEIAEPTIFAFRKNDLRSLAGAVATDGRDVTEQLSRQDQDFVQGFDRRLRQGLCPPHWVDLDFGDLERSASTREKVYLVLTGWILPTDTSLNIQIGQNPELPPIEFPSVWVPDSTRSEGWRKAIAYMGFPGGKTKTIVVDVTDILVAEDPRLRIRTSAQIYWDSAQLAIQQEPAPYRVQHLELESAEVDYHGFSKRIEGLSRQPESYDYTRPDLSPQWPPLRGPLTRFGPCTDLVRQWDDSMVVIGAGDEIRFRFAVPQEEPPEGWRRDFVLHCVGWDKDADLNTLSGQTTGPLPFKEMTSYPPTTAEADAAQRAHQENHRHRRRHQSFRSFWPRGGQEPPSRFWDGARDGLMD